MRRNHEGKPYEESLWLSKFIAGQTAESELDPEAMANLYPEDDYWNYYWKADIYKERELCDIMAKKEKRELAEAERHEKERRPRGYGVLYNNTGSGGQSPPLREMVFQP